MKRQYSFLRNLYANKIVLIISILAAFLVVFICYRTYWLLAMPGEGVRPNEIHGFCSDYRFLTGYLDENEYLAWDMDNYIDTGNMHPKDGLDLILQLLSLPFMFTGTVILIGRIMALFVNDDTISFRLLTIVGCLFCNLIAINLLSATVCYLNIKNPYQYDVSLTYKNKVFVIPPGKNTSISIYRGIHNVSIKSNTNKALLLNRNFAIPFQLFKYDYYIDPSLLVSEP